MKFFKKIRTYFLKFLTISRYNEIMAEFKTQFDGGRLTTAQIFYHLPDYDAILQEYIWQDYDVAPRFPNLLGFLSFWEKKIEGKLHSVYVAKQELITPGEYRFADWEGVIQ